MIRVFYRFKGHVYEHSMPVADMSQFELRRGMRDYNLAGAVVTRAEPIVTQPATKGEEEYYARYGTAGEF